MFWGSYGTLRFLINWLFSGRLKKSGYCQRVHTDDFGEEFEGLALLARAVLGARADAGPVSEDDPELVDEARLVKEALPELPEREYRIMSMRFGFGEFVGSRHTLEEVAESEDITRERVRQIEQITLIRMRKFPGILEKIQELITESSNRSGIEDD